MSLPAKICSNPNCKKEYIPRIKAQKYCCQQCNIFMQNSKRMALNPPKEKEVKPVDESEFYNPKEYNSIITGYLSGTRDGDRVIKSVRRDG